MQHLWHVCQCPCPVCTEQGAVYRIAPYTIQYVNILGQDILSNSTTIFCLCIISIIRLQVSTWTTVVLQYNVSGWPGCCMSRLWYAILHCVRCSRADCGVWRHKNVPIQLSSQRSESGPGDYTCFKIWILLQLSFLKCIIHNSIFHWLKHFMMLCCHSLMTIIDALQCALYWIES